jgi:hypothetical protein
MALNCFCEQKVHQPTRLCCNLLPEEEGMIFLFCDSTVLQNPSEMEVALIF